MDISYDRVSHLLKRIDRGPEAAYADFGENSKKLAEAPVAQMSKLTRTIMSALDYERVAERRKANFAYLHSALKSDFPFAMSEDDVPLVYPYVTEDMTLRARLIANKIFAAKYWPNLSGTANELADRIIAIPLDQRYGLEDMKRIVEVING